MIEQLNKLIDLLNEAQKIRLNEQGFNNSAFFDPEGNLTRSYKYYLKQGRVKFHKINCGSSGVFMIEINTGEIYNIKGYGVPDYNKKQKANLGNIKDYNTVKEAYYLITKRYNYLR